MSATIAVDTEASIPNGTPAHVSGANFSPGRTVNMYVNGNFVGVLPTGPFGTTPYGVCRGQLGMPVDPAATYPVEAQDNTDETTATTTVTLT